ncbi:MAG: ATP-binding protein [Elusimicrobia bacterium]|nr:ATP-binding protein [Elusimicrobiota bacterium]
MSKIDISLTNCYGINKLDYTFDFDATKSYAIYAPNGTMKTSFAKTLLDYSKNQQPNILPFPNIIPVIEIKEDNKAIEPNEIFVIKSEVSNFQTEKMSTLLVNKELRDKHLKITKDIEEKKEILLKELEKVSGIKNTKGKLEIIFIKDIVGSEKKNLFLTALNDLRHRVSISEKQFINVTYSILFNSNTEKLFTDSKFINELEKYMETYDKLISSSVFFKRGVFNHTNADIITKQLIENGFFKASHKVSINTKNGIKEISTDEDLKKAIEEEKSYILNSSELKKSFENFSKILQRNAETRALATYLEQNPNIIENLRDWQNFKRDIWASFFKEIEVFYNDLVQSNDDAQPKLKAIQEQAKKETSKWDNAVQIFKDRFYVPFDIKVDNKIDVMLSGEEVAPALSFKYIDRFTGEKLPIKKDDLYTNLSTGEQRALYILDIIFEIEARKELKAKTLFIFDDIADSFDYKNKYAIIQYLYELNKENKNSYQIILTHNFDFFRTVVSRLGIKRDYALSPEISKNEISFKKMPYLQDLFKVWNNELGEDKNKLIASIPFIRNIAGYCGLKNIENKLTALLHINPQCYPNTNKITIADLEAIVKFVLKSKDANFVLCKKTNNLQATDIVKDIIYSTADTLIKEGKNLYLLENKIVLSIAIRLKVEEFILSEIGNNKILDLEKYQTFNLIQNHIKYFGDKYKKLFTEVQLITPENIHLNSFMYEPILDTGYESLVDLYKEVSQLQK